LAINLAYKGNNKKNKKRDKKKSLCSNLFLDEKWHEKQYFPYAFRVFLNMPMILEFL
jgi:hypothetical protein